MGEASKFARLPSRKHLEHLKLFDLNHETNGLGMLR